MTKPELINIPFTSGAREDIDEKLHPVGVFSRITDARLSLTGKLGPRRRYSALPPDGMPATTESGANQSAPRIFRATQALEFDGRLLAFGSHGTVSPAPDPVVTDPVPVPRVVATYSDAGVWTYQEDTTDSGTLFPDNDVRKLVQFPQVPRNVTQRVRIACTGGSIPLLGVARAFNATDSELTIVDPFSGAIVQDVRVPGGTGASVVAGPDGSLLFFYVATGTPDLRAIKYQHGVGFRASQLVFPLTGGDSVVAGAVVETASTLTGIAFAVSGAATEGAAVIGHLTDITNFAVNWKAAIATARYVRPASGTLASTPKVYWAYNSGTNVLIRRDNLSAVEGQLSATTAIGVQSARPPALLLSLTSSSTEQATLLYTTGTTGSIAVRGKTVTGAQAGALTLSSELQVDRSQIGSGMWGDGRFTVIAAELGTIAGKSASFLGGRGVTSKHQGYSFVIERGNVADVLDHAPIATLGGLVFGAFALTDELSTGDATSYVAVYTWSYDSAAWRSTAKLGKTLFIAGGGMQQFDGARLVESGLAIVPFIAGTATTTTPGAITVGQHQWIVQYRWRDARGDRHEGTPSAPALRVLSAEATLTMSVSSPRTERMLSRSTDATSQAIQGLEVAVYRTKAAPDSTFRRVPGTHLSVTFSVLDASSLVSIIDSAPDSALDEMPLLDDVLSTSPNLSPEPCIAVWAGRDRLFAINGYGYQVSKRLEHEHTVHWSPLSAFFGRVEGTPRAIWSLDDLVVIATDDQLYGIAGEGPDNAGNGGFGAPTRIPGAVGCIGQQSVVQDSQGVWFVDTAGRLMHHSRGNGPVWRGEPVRQTLAAFPVVVGAAVSRRENTVCWLLRNSANEARIVAYDTRADCWYIDTLSELFGGKPTCLFEYRDRLGIVADGIVYTQDAEGHADTAKFSFAMDVAPFGADGWGSLARWSLLGSFAAGSTITSTVEYTDGTIGYVGPGVTEATAVRDAALEWAPRRRKDRRYRISFDVEGYPDSLYANALTLHVRTQGLSGKKQKTWRR